MAISAFILYYTFQDTDKYQSWMDLRLPMFVSGLGAASAMSGILYSDSSLHAFLFGHAVLISLLITGISAEMEISEVIPGALKISSPLLIVALCSLISPLGGLFSLVSKFHIIHPISILLIGSVPLASVLFGCSQLISKLNVSDAGNGLNLNLPIHLGTTLSMAFASLTLFYLYIQNRSHKNGDMIVDSKKKGAGVATFFAVMTSTFMASQHSETYFAIFPLLVGSLSAILLAAFFASIADVWYPVGTGQFQMISLDSSAILLYVVTPLFVLYFRFLEKHGAFCEEKLILFIDYASSAGILPTVSSYDIEDMTMVSLLLMLGVVTAVGVPLLNVLCPLGGHIYGRLYTHGQPNTKRIALCVDFSDLFDNKVSMDGRKELWEALNKCKSDDEGTSSLNVFVTMKDMKQNAALVKELIAAGHFVGIGSNNDGSLIDIIRWKSVEVSLKESFDEFAVITGTNPSWFHVGAIHSEGMHPASFQKAYKLGMRAAMWSVHTFVNRSTGLSDAEMASIRDGVEQHRGGNFIYVSSLKRSKGNGSVAEALRQIVTNIQSIENDGGYVFESMPAVAKENPGMILS
eukprot:CAMPEP_0185729456 /NCGR_PEP_ID=MMETSP1171-20130828/5807_1 /TAXON_ID=374046 /ORGANISM="Helicotheca tamensis, Strain CCMP826" /LENGTH=575 /DNA_ID=CAMNT_0028398297 /DNA_START=155 /DNA_END=1882 /DNA_ORIENTATION=-